MRDLPVHKQDMVSFPLDTTKCKRCGKQSIIQDAASGEIFCKSCGVIIVQKILDSTYKSKNTDIDSRTTGEPFSIAIHDFGLSTLIGRTNKDAKGNSFTPKATDTINRIRIQDLRSQAHKNKDTTLRMAFGLLQRIQDKIGISDAVKELAAHIYRKAIERKITQGRSMDAVVAASVYAACRSSQTLRTLRDISESSGVKRKKISQSYRALVKQLEITIPVVDQTRCILKISNNLGIVGRTKNLALEIIQKAESIGILAGRDPVGISAGAVYYACILRKEKFTQTQVAQASGITAVTVRNRYLEIQKKVVV